MTGTDPLTNTVGIPPLTAAAPAEANRVYAFTEVELKGFRYSNFEQLAVYVDQRKGESLVRFTSTARTD